MTDEEVIKAWCGEVRFAWVLARSERLGELRGRRSKLMDERGLHPLSLLVGKIESLQEMLPSLRELDFDPLLLKREAQRDAEYAFRVEGALDMGFIDEQMARAILGDELDDRRRHRKPRRSGSAEHGAEGPDSLRDLAF
jgi:hypothetical protein